MHQLDALPAAGREFDLEAASKRGWWIDQVPLGLLFLAAGIALALAYVPEVLVYFFLPAHPDTFCWNPEGGGCVLEPASRYYYSLWIETLVTVPFWAFLFGLGGFALLARPPVRLHVRSSGVTLEYRHGRRILAQWATLKGRVYLTDESRAAYSSPKSLQSRASLYMGRIRGRTVYMTKESFEAVIASIRQSGLTEETNHSSPSARKGSVSYIFERSRDRAISSMTYHPGT